MMRKIIGFIVLGCSLYILFHSYHTKYKHKTFASLFTSSNLPIKSQAGNIKLFRRSCDTYPNDAMHNLIKNNGWSYDLVDWNLYLPADYNNERLELEHIPSVRDKRVVLMIDNSDQLVGKDKLWNYLASYYGQDKASKLNILSYDLSDAKQMDKFKTEYDEKQLYIMKKNVQRQTGIKLTKSLKHILKGSSKQYAVVQPVFTDTYLVHKRKIGLRVYIGVLCHKGQLEVYMHNEGIVHFTQKDFDPVNDDLATHITTGYVDPSFYDNFPQTHSDFRKYLDDPNRSLSIYERTMRKDKKKLRLLSYQVFRSIERLLHDVMIPYQNVLGINGKQHLYAQMYGVDVGLRKNLSPFVIEINKGPDFNFKGNREGVLKYNVMEDMMRLVGLVDTGLNGFVRIL